MSKRLSLVTVLAFSILIAAGGWLFIAGGDELPDDAPSSMAPEMLQINQAAADSDIQTAVDLAASQGLSVDDGRVQIVIEAADDETSAAAAAESAGGIVETSYENLVQVSVPVENLGQLADSPSVSYMRPPQKPIQLAVTSEGVADIAATAWQTSGHTGAGVKVAIADPGFKGYTQRVASGDLPPDLITRSFKANGDIENNTSHGTACAEIVYDVAPDAQIYLVNFDTDVELGNAIDFLVSEGIDAVSASWAWPYAFKGDGSGTINDMVSVATTAGIFWANAAGNAAQNHWSGAFVDSSPANSWAEFSGTDERNDFVALEGSEVLVFLTWDDWPVTDQDYDIYLYKNGVPTPVASSTDPQTGTQKPAEAFMYVVPPGGSGSYSVAIRNASADGVTDLELFSYYGTLQYQVADGSIAGQPADSASVVTVGAVNVNTNNLASYSSRGPTSDARVKPDIAAPTRVTTGTYGMYGFDGTSASAPHVAGAAALVKGAFPSYAAATMQSTLEGTATDLGVPGKDNLFGSGKLNMGAAPPPPAEYYFSWYDELSPNMSDWVMLTNPNAQNDIGHVLIGGESQGGYQIAPGSAVTPRFPGVMGGVVTIESPGSEPLIASQRILYNDSFSEHTAVSEAELDDEYYFTWYDELSSGLETWIIAGNQGSQPTNVEIYIHGQLMGIYPLDPGEIVTPHYPGVNNGPVYVRSDNGQALLVSERATYKGTFSEVTGTPVSSLTGEYHLNWYDQLSPGMSTWIMIANPTASPVNAEVNIGGVTNTYDIAPGGISTPVYPGIMTGPVRVKSAGGESLVVSERTIMGDSFSELKGTPQAAISTNAWFNWYDQVSSGMSTWILVSNQGAMSTSVQVYIGGVLKGTYAVPAGGSLPVQYPGVSNGPVRITSTGQDILVTERTLYKGSFNEVGGVVIP